LPTTSSTRNDHPQPEHNRSVRADWTIFRTLRTLCQKSGVPPQHTRRLVIKELVDNGLDNGGECTIGELGAGRFFVEDDGPGISGSPEEIAELFSVNRALISSKVERLPTRGALGNGLRVVAGAVLASGGSPIEVWTKGKHLRLSPDPTTGKTHVQCEPCDHNTGTRIEVALGPSVPVDEEDTSWAQVAIDSSGDEAIYSGNTSAYWYDSDSWFELLQAKGETTVREVVSRIAGCSGEKARIVAAQFGQRPANSLSFAESEELLRMVRQATDQVSVKRLKLLGRDAFIGHHKACRGVLHLKPGRGNIGASLPFTVEAWVATSDEDCIEVLVNRTPVTGEIAVNRQDKKGNIGIFGCGLKHRFKVGKKPVAVLLNIQVPYMPITTDGKAPDLQHFVREIKEVLEKAAKGCQRANPTPRSEGSKKAIIIDHLPAAITHAGGGSHRFSLRTLFYAMRHVLSLERLSLPLWGWFCQVITEYEEEQGQDIPGIYRNDRGKLYIPHLRKEIPLGTLTVEQYKHVAWTYNKVLYVEKEGIYEIIKASGWAERNDCLLVTSQGFATRAARDVIDLLAESDGELQFFCIHDGDAYGTLIHEKLQEATKARGARRIRIVNLGLDPWQGLGMGLAVEQAAKDENGQKRKPVGEYVRQQGLEWEEWLQTQRIELNAMTTPQLLEWLDCSMKKHGNGKILPPDEVLSAHLAKTVHQRVREAERERILHEAGFEAVAEQAFQDKEAQIRELSAGLRRVVRRALTVNSNACWRNSVEWLAGWVVGTDEAQPPPAKDAS
jgi:hypothetical protein